MCGICGTVNLNTGAPVCESVLRAMNASITHRGPDDAGLFVDGPVGLAMSRLSIIDLAGGSQPIWNEDRTVTIVYNGELYNYRQLTTELTAHGHRFQTLSDTETIVHAYEQWGVDCVKRLRGMFAFAIWDARRRMLLLARDRFGIKPVFYAPTRDGIVFGSEIKSLLAGGISREMDPVALDQYFSHFCVPTPRTIFKAIRRLPPGHVLIGDVSGLREVEYWDLEYDPEPRQRPATEYVHELRTMITDAVRRHLQSDVPVGAFLSGGLDSGAVVAAMSTVADQPVHTFTIGFDELTYDERPAARQIAARFGTRHTDRTVRTDWRTLLPALARAYDEPFGDYSSIPTYLVSSLAREHVKVVLSGDGGDELLAGYPTHFAHRVSALYRRVPALVRMRLIAPLVRQLPPSMNRIPFEYRAKRFVVGAELPFQEGHLHWKVIFDEAEKEHLYSPGFATSREPDGVGFALYKRFFEKATHLDPLHQLLYVDAKTFLLDDNLTKIDRASMAHGVEVRVPLLDDELTEWVRRVPATIKQPAWGTKHLLRAAMQGILPDAVVRGAKKGFTPPMAHWLQGSLKTIMLDALDPTRIAKTGIFNEGHVRELVTEHLEGRQDHNRRLWALMSFMFWWDAYQPT